MPLRPTHFFALAALLGFLRPASAADPLPYKDTSLPFDKRVADLVQRMSLQEKAEQMQIVMPANAQWGIPAMRWGAEGLHGLPGYTIFPDAMALAATFDPALVNQVASAIGDDARIRGNVNTSTTTPNTSMVLWCPTVNMARDPRWGRNMETFGEDPFLSARLGAAYCLGMQGDDPKYIKTVAAPKHFVAYSQESQRTAVNAVVSQRALREYYLPAFEACFIQGHAAGTMSAYNSINGIPCSASDWLLTQVLRNEWHFDGAVSTDSRAVANMFSAHHYSDSEESAVAAAVNAGVDVIYDTAGGGRGGINSTTTQLIVSASEKGLIKPGAVDRAVTQSLLVRFRLGQFDPGLNPYSKLAASPERTQAHVTLALQAARESITLLQNNAPPRGSGSGPLLPIDLRRVNSIAIIGPGANISLYGSYANGQVMTGRGGSPTADAGRGPNPLAALTAAVGDRVQLRTTVATDTEAMVEAARTSDLVIYVGGNDTRVDHAGSDRTVAGLPPDQVLQLNAVTHVNPLTVLVLSGGSSINLDDYKTKCPAIVMSWYNGEQGGNALAEVLLGITNPSGRLPITFYQSFSDLPGMDDYEVMTGRTYLYFKKPVSFPFGTGLSYTTFAYDNFKITSAPKTPTVFTPGGAPDNPGNITLSLDVANTGTRDGDEIVQIYAHQLAPKITRPLKQLVAMARVPLPKSQKKSLTFTVPLKSLATWEESDHQWTLDPGTYEFSAAASSEDIRQRATVDLK